MADDVVGGYDQVAAEYGQRLRDELAHKPLDRGLLAAFAEMAPDGLIADLGCGPGHVALQLNRLGRQVIGIDLSPRMIEVARVLSPGPEYRVGNLLQLELDDGSLAGAIAFYSIIHLTIDQLKAAFAELRRVLMPEGLALIAFHTGRHTVHLDRWWDKDVSIDFHFHPTDQVERLLTQAGLEIESSLRRQPGPQEVQTVRSYVMARRSRITLRPATNQDREFLRSLHHSCYRQYVEPVWGWDETEQDRRFAESWSTADRAVVELVGVPIGALQVSRQPDQVFVADIEIHPDHQGGGIGSRLLRWVLAEADQEGLPVRLQVLRNNPARRLYERLGFTVENTTETHYLMLRPARI